MEHILPYLPFSTLLKPFIQPSLSFNNSIYIRFLLSSNIPMFFPLKFFSCFFVCIFSYFTLFSLPHSLNSFCTFFSYVALLSMESSENLINSQRSYFCNLQSLVKMSWSCKNSRKRFIGCQNYRSNPCKFFLLDG